MLSEFTDVVVVDGDVGGTCFRWFSEFRKLLSGKLELSRFSLKCVEISTFRINVRRIEKKEKQEIYGTTD